MSILMNVDAFRKWEAAHPLGSSVAVSVAGEEFQATVAEFSDYHGKVEVRLRLNRGEKK